MPNTPATVVIPVLTASMNICSKNRSTTTALNKHNFIQFQSDNHRMPDHQFTHFKTQYESDTSLNETKDLS